MILDIRMGDGSSVDVFQEFGSCEAFVAAFAGFQGMLADDLISNQDRPNVFFIDDANSLGRAHVGAGPAADAAFSDGDNEQAVVAFGHFQSIGPDNFLANPLAQELLAGNFGDGDTIKISVGEKGKLAFSK